MLPSEDLPSEDLPSALIAPFASADNVASLWFCGVCRLASPPRPFRTPSSSVASLLALPLFGTSSPCGWYRGPDADTADRCHVMAAMRANVRSMASGAKVGPCACHSHQRHERWSSRKRVADMAAAMACSLVRRRPKPSRAIRCSMTERKLDSRSEKLRELGRASHLTRRKLATSKLRKATAI